MIRVGDRLNNSSRRQSMWRWVSNALDIDHGLRADGGSNLAHSVDPADRTRSAK
jgi:hypothetical protein